MDDGGYFTSNITDKIIREKTYNTDILDIDTVANPDNVYDADRNGVLILGESNAKGSHVSMPVYTNAMSMKNLALDGLYKTFTDPYMSATGSILKGSLLEATTNLGTSWPGALIDDLITDTGDEWFTCGSAEGATSIANEWQAYNADGVMSDLLFIASVRYLQAAAVGTVKAIVIDLGVNDALEGTTAAEFVDGAQDIIDQLRGLAGFNIPIIFVGMHKWTADITGITEAKWNEIDGAIDTIVANNSKTRKTDISRFDPRSGDEYHYKASDLPAIGADISTDVQALI